MRRTSTGNRQGLVEPTRIFGYRASRDEGSYLVSTAVYPSHPAARRGRCHVDILRASAVTLRGPRGSPRLPRPTRRHQGFSARSGLVPSQGHVGEYYVDGGGASASGLGLGFRVNVTDRCRSWPRPPRARRFDSAILAETLLFLENKGDVWHERQGFIPSPASPLHPPRQLTARRTLCVDHGSRPSQDKQINQQRLGVASV